MFISTYANRGLILASILVCRWLEYLSIQFAYFFFSSFVNRFYRTKHHVCVCVLILSMPYSYAPDLNYHFSQICVFLHLYPSFLNGLYLCTSKSIHVKGALIRLTSFVVNKAHCNIISMYSLRQFSRSFCFVGYLNTQA